MEAVERKDFSIESLEIAGVRSALEALRLPFGKECRSEAVNEYVGWVNEPEIINFNSSSHINIHPKDMLLMSTLVKRGDEHAKVVRGIIAYAKITAPVYWWSEMETYRAGHERLSSESTMHIDARGLSGNKLVEVKKNIPMGKMLTKVDFFSYQCLRNIVKQRHNHRLPEWHLFVDWVKALPFADELILAGLNIDDNDE
jgi:hypothetical protein